MSYFDTINKFNQEANDKFENTSRLMSVAIEDKANTLRDIHQNLVAKYETGAVALSGLSGAWMGARKVYSKLSKSSPKTEEPKEPKEDEADEAEDPAEAVDDSPKIEDLDGETEVGEVAPDILTAEGAAPISANAAAFGGGGATAASGAETAGGAAAGTEAGGAAAAGSEGAAAAAGAEGAAATGTTLATTTGTTLATTTGTTVAETTGATIGGATGEAAASTALDFLGPVGLAAGAVLGLVDLFKGIFDKVPKAEDLQKQATIVSGGGSIDAASIVKAIPVTQTLV